MHGVGMRDKKQFSKDAMQASKFCMLPIQLQLPSQRAQHKHTELKRCLRFGCPVIKFFYRGALVNENLLCNFVINYKT